MIGFIIGVFVGGILGVVLMALMAAAIGGRAVREILFRGKTYDNEWVEGFYVNQFGAHEIYCLDDSDYQTRHIDPSTIGQYTGLTDKNGTRVFEGDILKIIHKYQSPFDDDTKEYTDIDVDVVHFDDEGLCFSYGKSPFLCVADNVTAEYEVVGNIHDNPELLEVTE